MFTSAGSKNARSGGAYLPRVLVVDDDPGILATLEKLLESSDYELRLAQSALEAISILRERECAVVVADHMMPNMTGLELLTLVRRQNPTTVCIMITATADIKVAEEVVNNRLAHYLITKPWKTGVLRQTVQEALETHRRQEQDPRWAFGEADRSSVQEHAFQAAFSLARAVDARDRHTHRHSERVSSFGQALGEAIGLDRETIEQIRIGGLLHDLGKIGIPDEILLKPGRLTEKEFRYIKLHPVIGVTITEPIDFPWNIEAIVRQHHENHDGSGYPTGLGGSDIALVARIVHVVDAYEAMSADRVYRKALPVEHIEQEFVDNRGTQFDPDVIDVFLDQLRRGKLV